jgi:hypothetical protein
MCLENTKATAQAQVFYRTVRTVHFLSTIYILLKLNCTQVETRPRSALLGEQSILLSVVCGPG